MDNNIRSHCPLSIVHNSSWIKKNEQVTMKAKFMHTWSVESEFVIKNSIFPWTSELAKNAKFTITLMSKEKLKFLLQFQILHFKYVWNLPSLSLTRFFLIQNELWTMWSMSPFLLLGKKEVIHATFLWTQVSISMMDWSIGPQRIYGKAFFTHIMEI